jgi:hypothetical protein
MKLLSIINDVVLMVSRVLMYFCFYFVVGKTFV